MAPPTNCLFPVLLLLSMLAATPTSTADHHRWLIPRPRPRPEDPACLPGQTFPAYALPRCRAYLAGKCVSDGALEADRQECCRQLAAVQEPRCKCEAIAHMLDSMYRGLSVEGGKQQQQEEAFPGCRTFMLSQTAARLPIVCGQEVPLSGSVCSWANNRWSPADGHGALGSE